MKSRDNFFHTFFWKTKSLKNCQKVWRKKRFFRPVWAAVRYSGGMGIRDPIFRYPESAKKWVEEKSNKSFLHFCAKFLKDHQIYMAKIWQKFGKKWRKVLFNLPSTRFSMVLQVPETRVLGTHSITSTYMPWIANDVSYYKEMSKRRYRIQVCILKYKKQCISSMLVLH